MTKAFIKSFVALALLMGLIIVALPTLASDAHSQIRARGWTQMFPLVSPPPRADTALAYDTARGVAILFGGTNGVAMNDHWELDSQTLTWTEREFDIKPAPRLGAAMVFDAARGVTLLHGGVTEYAVVYDDFWQFDGESWTQLFPENLPSARWRHRMVYDSARQIVVMAGGLELGTGFNQTFEWDGVSWVERTDIAPFAARYGFGLAYDPRRDVTVMFAGDDGLGWTYFNDTYERAGDGDWVWHPAGENPTARKNTYAAYFPRLRRTVAYGGVSSYGLILDQTLIWHDTRWWLANPIVHPTGIASAILYDPIVNGLLMYVGFSATGQFVSETWYLR